MHIISGNNITLTRGDTLKVQVTLYKNGAEYTPEAGDVIRFAMKKEYTDALPVLSKTIPNASREMYADFYERAVDEGALD